MLMPKRTKYRKSHRLSYEGKAKGNLTLTIVPTFGIDILPKPFPLLNIVDACGVNQGMFSISNVSNNPKT